MPPILMSADAKVCKSPGMSVFIILFFLLLLGFHWDEFNSMITFCCTILPTVPTPRRNPCRQHFVFDLNTQRRLSDLRAPPFLQQ